MGQESGKIRQQQLS